MKTTIKTHNMIKLLFLLLLFTGLAKAQIVNIPDANFKNRLVNTFCVDSNNDNLPDIDADSNNDGEIQNSEALAVTNLNINNYLNPISSQISSLTGIEFFINLESLNLLFNQITSLNLTNNTLLKRLDFERNLISNLNLSNNLLLTNLSCQYNELTSLDISGLLNLKSLSCNNNQLTSLDLSSNLALIGLSCGNNQLTSLDITGLTNLQDLYFNNNPFLSYVFIKNEKNNFDGTPPNIVSGCPNLNFICADENETLTFLQNQPNFNVVINSYCNFTPGGNYNTISGILKNDANSNGCDASDFPQPNIRVNINDGTNTGASFTSSTGNYKFYTQAGSFTIIPEVENPTWFNFTPATATIPFADNNNNTATQDFCISANGVHHDLEIIIAPIGVARPGFDAEYQITYSNRGNSNFATGEISLVFNDAILDFIQASNIPISQNPGAINWIFTNLLPFETRTITVTFNVNSPIETPAVNINDVLTYTVNCYPSYFEENLTNNQLIYNQTVVGSFDPNDITCLEGNTVAPTEIGKYLHYVINFENTGNFPAENVVVKTIVDPAKFDINSLQLLNTSNPVDARITGNVVEFIFEDIQLAGPGGHGHVLLKIKSKNTLVTGDTVAKRADIFFDYNAPVDTGMATTVFQSLSNILFDKDDSISVSPNPTTSIININSNFNIKSIELYDVQGRVLQTILNANKLDISEKTNGIYFLKITTEKGSKIEKLVKE